MHTCIYACVYVCTIVMSKHQHSSKLYYNIMYVRSYTYNMCALSRGYRLIRLSSHSYTYKVYSISNSKHNVQTMHLHYNANKRSMYIASSESNYSNNQWHYPNCYCSLHAVGQKC